jgi:hypothetical protein
VGHHLDHLRLAQVVRLEVAAVRREIREGALSVADALRDPRAASLTVFDLLRAQRQWGRTRVVRFLHFVGSRMRPPSSISEQRRVRDLTERQRDAIAAALDGDES